MKKEKVILLFTSICLAALIALSAGCRPAPAPQSTAGKTLKVGMMTPSTGPAAEKGRPGGHGALDAWEYINKELGGVNGYQVDVQWRDSAYDSSKVVTIVNSFMDSGCLMFTTHASAEMTAAKEAANRAGFPGMATYTSPVLYRPPQHIYGQMPDYGDDWTTFAKYYLQNIWKGTGKPKMALHLLNNSTGAGARDAARAMADTLGIDIVDVEEHAATTISEMESLTRIRATNPDVLFISSTPAPTAVILKNAYDLGMYPGMTIACAHASFTKALIDLAGADVVEGVYGVFPTVSWDDTNVPGIAKAAEYCKKNNPDDYGNMDYLTCWSTSLIMAEILKNALNNVGYDVLAKGDAAAWQAVETQGIQKLSGYDVQGIHGPVSYTPGDNRLDKFLKIYQITGGKITAISDWVEAPLIKYEDFDWFGK